MEGGSQINASNDHRIAMSFACLGLISKKGIKINGASSINTSFPNFIDLMQLIGAIVIIPKRKT